MNVSRWIWRLGSLMWMVSAAVAAGEGKWELSTLRFISALLAEIVSQLITIRMERES